MKPLEIKTCNKCCNAQAEKNSKYCKRCNNKIKRPKILNLLKFT